MPDLLAYRRHVLQALQFADIIKVSDEDLVHLDLPQSGAREKARTLLDATQAQFLILTCGADGASVLTRHGETFSAREAMPLQVKDTVGAGDCFLAGLVCAYLDLGLDTSWGRTSVPQTQAKKLLQYAIACASICVSRQGCEPPTLEDVVQRIREQPAHFLTV